MFVIYNFILSEHRKERVAFIAFLLTVSLFTIWFFDNHLIKRFYITIMPSARERPTFKKGNSANAVRWITRANANELIYHVGQLYRVYARNSRGKPLKDWFLSTLSNERKFPEVGANSIVSFVAWHAAFTRMWKRASQLARASALTRGENCTRAHAHRWKTRMCGRRRDIFSTLSPPRI